MERHYDALVVGAGIAGLAAARLFVRAGLRTGVLEAESRAGGAIHTATVDSGGFWLELGAHTLFNSYGSLLTLFPELGVEQRLLRRRRLPFRLWSGGEPRSISSALHFGELLVHVPAALRTRDDRSIADWFGAAAGPRNYAEVIGPSLSALLCQPADDFPAALLFKRRRRAPGYPRNFSVRGGLGALAEAMARGLDLHCRTPVVRLLHDGAGVHCETEGGRYTAPRVMLAVPADQAARLIADMAPDAARRLAAIPMQPLHSTALAVPRHAVTLPPLAGMVARGAPWYSMVSRDVIPDPRLRGFTFHFGAPLAPEERLLMAAEVLRVPPHAVVAAAHTRHRLPGLRSGHQNLVREIDDCICSLPVGLAGNYFGGLSIEDCVERARSECDRLMLNHRP